MKSLFFLAMFGLSALALGDDNDEHQSVRDNCRKVVGGAYLAAYDRKEQATKLVQHLDGEIKANTKSLKIKTTAYEKYKKDAETHEFSVAKAEARDGAKSLVDTIRNQIGEAEVLMRRAKNQQEENTALSDSLRKKINKVFVIETLKSKKDGGYPFQLRYRSECSKYKYTCPLSRQEAKDLLDIYVNDENPDSCVKYAAMSGVTP